MPLLRGSGRVKMLRVNNVGDKYGATDDQVEAEVIAQLEGQEPKVLWFRLIDDPNLPVRNGYLDLLRDALNYGHIVNAEYEIKEGSTKGRVVRLWLTPAPRPTPGTAGGGTNPVAAKGD